MGDEGEVVAVERHPGRARALRASCARMRTTSVSVTVADAREFEGRASFDRVLLDPPCSGLGTLRSHPDLRWRTSPEAIAHLAGEQDLLLASARRALRPGGTLVYSVCTLSPQEERLRAGDVRRTFPHRDGSDGFYIARDGG
jgi:16S rRNA (cytosine967-C5)-methyltransferase